MAIQNEKNTAYNALIALAEQQMLRKALVARSVVFFANQSSLETLKSLGIEPVVAGEAVTRALQQDGIYDASQYPLTFTHEALRAAIEKAAPKNVRANVMLPMSVQVNTPNLPYTEASQRDLEARQMMLR